MASRLLIRRNVAPATAGILAAVVISYPRIANAESPESQDIRLIRKPIYDDPHEGPPRNHPRPQEIDSSPSPTAAQSTSADTSTDSSSNANVPTTHSTTPTDRLAAQIRRGRLQLYEYSNAAEARVNTALSRALDAESTVASTVASLAPPPTAREPLVPGVAYILVAALAGSIVTRNRGFMLRTLVPLTFGGIAARTALPVTTGNVGALVWRWEMDKFPEVAAQQAKMAERVEQFLETGKEHLNMTGHMIDEKAHEARKGIEDWVRQGK